MKTTQASSRPTGAAWLRPFRNAGILALGRGMQGVLSLAYVALASRTLGPSAFGVLVLVHSTVLVAAQLVRFQSWQAVLKYGAPALLASDRESLHRVLFFALGLDIVSAALASAILAHTMPAIAAFVGIPDTVAPLATLYAMSVAFVILGAAPLGVLRLLDRHDLISWQTIVEPLVRCAGAVFLFVSDGSLAAFLLVWFIATALGKGALFVAASKALAARGLSLQRAALDRRCLAPAPGIWRFSAGTNLSSMLNLNDTQIGPLLAGNLLGAADAGLYRIAQQVANVVSKPVHKLLVPAIYTDMSQLTAAGDRRTRRDVVARSGPIAGLAGLAIFAFLAMFGADLLALVFGDAYREAAGPMLWLAFAGVLATFAFPLAPLLMSGGKVRHVVIIRLAALAAYLVAFYLLVPAYALLGAGVTVNVHALVTVAGMAWCARDLLRADATRRP